MANPRSIVDDTEILAYYQTFKRKTSSTGAIDFLHSATAPYPAGTGTTTQYGQSAAIDGTNDNQVKVGAAGDHLVGRIVRSEADGMVVVQTRGIAVFPYTAGGNAPVRNRGVVCDGSGGVRIAGAGSEYTERGSVRWIDSTNLICGVDLQG